MTTKPKLKKIPLPEGIGPLPKGAVYLGAGPLKTNSGGICGFYRMGNSDDWDYDEDWGVFGTGHYAAPSDSAIAREILGEPAKPVTKRKAEKKAPALRKLPKNVKPGTRVVCIHSERWGGLTTKIGKVYTVDEKQKPEYGFLYLKEDTDGYYWGNDHFRLAPSKPSAKKANAARREARKTQKIGVMPAPATPIQDVIRQRFDKFGKEFCQIAERDGIIIPDWLPALPPVPSGYDRWEPRGEKFEIGPLCVYGCASKGCASFRTVRAGSEPFQFAKFYIEAVRDEKPFKRALENHTAEIDPSDKAECRKRAAEIFQSDPPFSSEDLEPVIGVSNDPVNHPSHYTQGGVECIDAIQSALSPEEFRGHLRGCAMKYLWRGPHKSNYAQDLAKAKWYLDRLAATIEKEKP